MDNIVGTKYEIVFCEGAEQSLIDISQDENQGKLKQYQVSILHQLKKLADDHRMSSGSFVTEGLLPNGSKFSAIRKHPLRAYLWRSSKENNTFYVSHFVLKRKNKLAAADIKIVCENWVKKENT